MANPKTAGVARWIFLALWGSQAQRKKKGGHLPVWGLAFSDPVPALHCRVLRACLPPYALLWALGTRLTHSLGAL